MSRDYGQAEYVVGRYRKNPVLVWQSRVHESRVYEYTVASKFKIPGLVSWKCMNCMRVKEDFRKLGEKLKQKIPLILVDNDIIKENPDRPLNSEHFCNGKDVVDAAVLRGRMQFCLDGQEMETNNGNPVIQIRSFAINVVNNTLMSLNPSQKRQVKRQLDMSCHTMLKRIQKKKLKMMREEEANANQEGPSDSNSRDDDDDSQEQLIEVDDIAREESSRRPKRQPQIRFQQYAGSGDVPSNVALKVAKVEPPDEEDLEEVIYEEEEEMMFVPQKLEVNDEEDVDVDVEGWDDMVAHDDDEPTTSYGRHQDVTSLSTSTAKSHGSANNVFVRTLKFEPSDQGDIILGDMQDVAYDIEVQ